MASVIGSFTWERYLARFVAFLVLLAVWQSGAVTRGFFIGLTPTGPAKKDAKDGSEQPRRLALYYGYPFKLFGRPLYSLRNVTEVTEEALTTPAEELTLWTRMSVFDARSLLGFYCYRANALRDAVHVWEFIPQSNLYARPEINQMLQEARNRVAIENEVDLGRAPAGALSQPLGTENALPDATSAPAQRTGRAEEAPSGPLGSPMPRPRLEPVPASEIEPDPLPPLEDAPLWTPASWVAATTMADPNAQTEHIPAVSEHEQPIGTRLPTPGPAFHNGSGGDQGDWGGETAPRRTPR
jgi:hypothetical protein